MTEIRRIRWRTDDDGETTGYVGSLDRPVFRIWPPDDNGDCLLFLYLAGHAGDLYHGATIDGQQAQAERLLGEFVSSLGAVFPDEPGTVLANVDEAEAFEADFRATHAPGRCVRFTRPSAGYPADQQMAARLLNPGEVYVIEWSDIGFSSSRLGLAGVESGGMGFNSVLFEPAPARPHPEEAGK